MSKSVKFDTELLYEKVYGDHHIDTVDTTNITDTNANMNTIDTDICMNITDDDAELAEQLLNEYITFFKSQISDRGIFSDINYADMSSTNIQMEFIYTELVKYKSLSEEEKDAAIVGTDARKYVIYKIAGTTRKPCCSSDNLIAILLEKIGISQVTDGSIKGQFEIMLKP